MKSLVYLDSKIFFWLLTGVLLCSSFVVFAQPPKSLEDAQQIIQSDLDALSKLKFGSVSTKHKNIFGDSSASSILEYIKNRVQYIEWDDEDTVDIVARGYHSTIVVGPQLFSPSISQIKRLAIYIHESKHAERSQWGHVNCGEEYSFRIFDFSIRFSSLDNSKVPEAVCDSSNDGAFGTQYVFLRSIVNSCLNCSDEIKLEAQLLSSYQVITMINDKGSAEQLILEANIDPKKAFKDLKTILINKFSSGLDFDEWKTKCKSTNTCLVTP